MFLILNLALYSKMKSHWQLDIFFCILSILSFAYFTLNHFVVDR